VARYFNGKKVELLAPAGNFEILKELLSLPCDAFYFGGKLLNMRLHRKDYNFSNAELVEAVGMARGAGKLAYITVNNLHGKADLELLDEYLHFLAEEAKPDAIIVQDFSVLGAVAGLGLNIHASVMMNVHNIETVRRLRELGVKRVVVSREASLAYVKLLAATTDMEFEYFVHGDMCIAHGGQCLYSQILFGGSSNMGKCYKPCRWDFDIEVNGNLCKTSFPLAAKDMCLYEYIPDLISNRVTSFKIEGRMRGAEYISLLVNAYGDAINRYIEDPLNFDRKKDIWKIQENRNRDTTTAYAFGWPDLSFINQRYEGTGKFFSSGKVFSKATEEISITAKRTGEIKEYLDKHKAPIAGKLSLGVKVNSISAAKTALDKGADFVYLSGETFLPGAPMVREDICRLAQGQRIYLCLPRMTFDIDLDEYSHFLDNSRIERLNIEGLVCTNLGAIYRFKGKHRLIGDYALNICNRRAAEFFLNEGLQSFTISPEVKLEDLADILNAKGEEAELIVHGSPTVMYLEHDLYKNLAADYAGQIYLVDEAGFKHPVSKDKNGRNHILLYKDLCLLPVLKELQNVGASRVRIEAAHMEDNEVARIVGVYRMAINDPDKCQALYDTLRHQYSFGALEF